VVESHVRSCADCQEELALLRAMSASLRRAPRVDVAAVAAAIPPYRAPVRRIGGGWRVAAAIVALAVGGTSVAVMQRDAMPPAQALEARELAVGTSAVSELDDTELLVLLDDIQSIEVLPSADVETSTLVPTSGGTE
jgi:hypothetical protein